MKITVYVDWDSRKVMNLEEAREEALEEIDFNEYLSDNYSIDEIFNMDEDKKKKVRDEFKNYAMEEYLDNVEEYTLDI